MQNTNANAMASLLRRDSALEHLLLGDLRDLLADPVDSETRAWLIVILDGLLRVLPREFCCEEAGGYLQEVLEEYPSWDRQVQMLRRQHISLHRRLREVRNEIERQPPVQLLGSRTRRKLLDWIEQLEEHNRQETDLLHTAVNLEVGVGD